MRYSVTVQSALMTLFLLISFSVLAQQQEYKWKAIGGRWEARKDNKASFLLESKSKTYNFGYSEIINYNSLISQNPLADPTSINFTFSLSNPSSSTENLFVFNAENLRIFYAFKLAGDGKKITRLSLISSQITDTTLPPSVKNNYTITELVARDCSLEYNTDINAEINIKKKKTLIINLNGKELLSYKIPGELHGGKIGFSNRNAILKIADLKVYSGKDVIFEDDFSTDTIKRLKVTAVKISETEDVKKK